MDKIEKFENALIHHGKYSDRLYILKFPEDGDSKLVVSLTNAAIKKGYSKVIGKIRVKLLPLFIDQGYEVETMVPKFFNGTDDCCFVSKFIDQRRAIFDNEALKVFSDLNAHYTIKSNDNVPVDISIRELTQADTTEMASVYRLVFETYPFPIFEEEYLVETMQNNVIYFGAFQNGKLLCISSSEMDVESQNAEMTDFAALNEARGLGLSKILLHEMEGLMQAKGIKTLYTIARLKSIPMNKTFLGAGYRYAGTLINNTNISGGIESMNILYKYT
ncbi:MAG: putative beta-lysine N-acetyltransferase [Prolixibacteraceae bacterium]